MTFLRWHRLGALGVGLLTLACGGDSTQPPGPPAEVVKSGGDGQAWYFNNPLPLPYSVTVRDANGRAVRGVPVTWAFYMTGDGTLSPNPSTTNANGVATTIHTLGAATTNVVKATVTGLSVTFSATGSAPPKDVAVNVGDNVFTPRDTAVQVNDSVTWTWSGSNPHSVTFGTGTPTSPTQTTGDYTRTFPTVGRFSYFCKVHATMTGTVTVVN